MKIFKRNMVILTVLMFVCVAVYLNWSYNKGEKQNKKTETTEPEITDTLIYGENNSESDSSDAGLFYTGETAFSGTTDDEYFNEYFNTARLSRQQARDSAIAILEETAANDSASQETIDSALDEIAVMAEYTMTESRIENLLLAKGFTECVVFLSDSAVNVIVPSSYEGLSTASVARITDTVTTETGLSPELIKIIEVK